jgi:DinB family protein
MSQELHATVVAGLVGRYMELAESVSTLAARLNEDQFWQKPFPFGNSFGHLVLHVTGNLNYYIGAEVGATGYVRDRDREFTEASRIPKGEALKNFNVAIGTVVGALQAQLPTDWARPYSALREETAGNRFNIFLRCATHLHHHVGQMNYLCFELAGNKPTGP